MPGTTAAFQHLSETSQRLGHALPERAWDILSQYREELLRQAQGILGRAGEAEDVVQETFLEAFHHEERLGEARSLGAWLKSINRANALTRLSARRRVERAPESSRRSMTTGGFSALELREAVAQALKTLPERERAVIELRFFQHLPFNEIAKRLGEPEGTVRWLSCEAMVRLHRGLSDFLPQRAPGQPRSE